MPARLLDGLVSQQYGVALLPVIDFQKMPDLTLLSAGGIGSEDQTLTVRIFSKVPVQQIGTLACDTESHTSVALARIVLQESFSIHPELVNLTPADDSEAKLLIGDKVICDTPGGYPYQLDLGSAWRGLTGLPFLFACWTAKRGAKLGALPDRLVRAKNEGLAHIEAIIRRDALKKGWPVDIARKYLTQHLQYDVGQRQLDALRLFYELSAKHGLLERVRELRVDDYIR